MKMRRSILLTVIGLFALCLGLKAEVYSGACGDSIAWSLDTETGVLAIEGKGEITFGTTYNQETEEWEQPKTWLQYKDKISSARIAEGVTCIGYEAFKDCSNLVSVSIPNSVTRIEGSAFSGCSNLKSLDIPNNVTSMGHSAFDGCDSLEYEIENDVKYLSNWAVGVVRGKTSYTIRQGTIGLHETFRWATDLKEALLPEGLISIGSNAFYNCRELTTINIPQSVTNIGSSAFEGCTNLHSITLPDALESIEP
jgi:hypothetical protein